ncbi:thiol-disulfide oxidoreductase DCC family protein [Bernardetia sp.]|uniref:thiol-disulfide oxidoreductase DCC family protein n=1 Tax=Bernardetia sp. TaxID=1937974 RepID=UPI0025C4B287|nr:DCC1-like thiol-disulfide oxidoreductase family protein [Bernardetia sp.]
MNTVSKHSEFQSLIKTSSPPKKTLLVWDGECGFCKYWITKWEMITDNKHIDLRPYQEVAKDFPDLDEKLFKKAVRLITPEGIVYSGASAAFKSLELGGATHLPMSWYNQNPTFAELTEWLYEKVADNRPFLHDVSHFFLGENPKKICPSVWVWAGLGAVIGGTLAIRLGRKK